MARYLRHVHSSSRFDRSTASLVEAFRTFTRRRHLVTFTEVAERRRDGLARFIFKAMPQWRFVKGSGDVVAAVYRPLYAVEEVGSIYLTNKIGRTVEGLVIRLRRRAVRKVNRRWVNLVVVHLPAHLDQRVNRLGWYESMENLEDWWVSTPGPKMICGDWNRDWRVKSTRQMFDDYFPRSNCTWDILPKGGTFEGRLIDFTITALVVAARRVLPLSRSSDHSPYSESLLLP